MARRQVVPLWAGFSSLPEMKIVNGRLENLPHKIED